MVAFVEIAEVLLSWIGFRERCAVDHIDTDGVVVVEDCTLVLLSFSFSPSLSLFFPLGWR